MAEGKKDNTILLLALAGGAAWLYYYYKKHGYFPWQSSVAATVPLGIAQTLPDGTVIAPTVTSQVQTMPAGTTETDLGSGPSLTVSSSGGGSGGGSAIIAPPVVQAPYISNVAQAATLAQGTAAAQAAADTAALQATIARHAQLEALATTPGAMTSSTTQDIGLLLQRNFAASQPGGISGIHSYPGHIGNIAR